MSKLKRKYFVSTDSIGFLGRPEQFIELWKEYFDNKTFSGVEAVAFKPLSRLTKLIKTLENHKIPVLSFHGKTGGESRLSFFGRIIMTVVNVFIIDIKTLLKYFPKIEFLSHAPYFEKKSVEKIVLLKKPKIIWIENHLLGKQGIEDAIRQIIFFRKNNINAHGILDIYHYVAYERKLLLINWVNIVNKLESYVLQKDRNGKQLFIGIHFPIGNRLDDSLPVDSMTDEMLKLFARKIIPHVEKIVFENQQTVPGILFSTNKMIEKQKKRNKRIIERLKRTGIIVV